MAITKKELLVLLDKAVENQTRHYNDLKGSTDIQVRICGIEAKIRADTLGDVAHALRGRSMYLKMLAEI